MTRSRWASRLTAFIATSMLGMAFAHGPCGKQCLSQTSGPVGTVVETRHLRGVLAVWNPRPNTLPLGVPGMSASCDLACARRKPIYHADQPSVILAEATHPRVLRFEVPQATPGRYLVLVYDGSENGFHYTWQPFTVTPGGSSGQEDDRRASPAWPLLTAAFLGAIMGALACAARGSRSEDPHEAIQ